MEVYQDFSTIVLKANDRNTFNLKFWRSFYDSKNRITTYSLSDDYTDYADEDNSGKLATQSDYIKFLSYLKINTSQLNWWSRCGQVISEEERSDEFGDYYSVYKFHYLITTPEGDILNIIPFSPIDFYLKE